MSHTHMQWGCNITATCTQGLKAQACSGIKWSRVPCSSLPHTPQWQDLQQLFTLANLPEFSKTSEQLEACSTWAFLVQSNDTDSTTAATCVIPGHLAQNQAKLQAVVLYRTEYKCTHHILVISLPVPTSKSLSAGGRFLGFFVSATLTNCWKTGLLENKKDAHT